MIIRLRTIAAASPLLLLWLTPLIASLIAFAAALFKAEGWAALAAHPQFPRAMLLSVFTAALSTSLALIFALAVTAGLYGAPLWRRLQALAGAALALPHLAFAIGFGFLIMPSGIAARLIAGGATPPAWVTTQDPAGLALSAALTLKEMPFLTLMMVSFLSRGDLAARLPGQLRAAASLGHGALSAWLRIVLPQLLPRLGWPLLAVFAYGVTVVDMALVIGPTQPPTLAVLVWRDLNAAEPWLSARGMAGAAALALAAFLPAAFARLGLACLPPLLSRFASAGPSRARLPRWPAMLLSGFTAGAYLAVCAVLVIMSFAARWPWPGLIPSVWSSASWQVLAASLQPALLSIAIAMATSLTAIAAAVLWFEAAAETADRPMLVAAGLAVTFPALATASGLYRIGLATGLSGTLTGLFLAHLMPVAAYCFIVLRGPYRSFDARFQAVARGLNAGDFRFWLAIKAPLLKPALLAAGAIGFSVSFVQYVPAQLLAAGRHATLPMGTVTLASGGDRPLLAASALVLAIPQAIVFLAAAGLARPRWSMP